MYEYKAKVINVVDGDTFDLDIDLGFFVTVRERVRLLDIDTPEKRQTKANEKEAGLAVTNWVKPQLEGKEVIIKSYKGTDSFGRWLVELYVEENKSILEIYNKFGINKKDSGYNMENCFKLEGKNID